MQLWVTLVFFVVALTACANAQFSVVSCSPRCYTHESERVTVTINFAPGTPGAPNSTDSIASVIAIPPTGQTIEIPLQNIVFTFGATNFSLSLNPSAVPISGSLVLTIFTSDPETGDIFEIPDIRTGYFVFSVSSSGITPLSYGFRFTFPAMNDKRLNRLQLGQTVSTGRSWQGSTVVRQDSATDNPSTLIVSVIDPNEEALGFQIAQPIFLNLTFADGNATAFFLTNVSQPQPTLTSRRVSFLPPAADGSDTRFVVPTNISMLPNEGAVVNRLEFTWEGGSYACPRTAAAVSNIGNEFYALVCNVGGDILRTARQLVVSVIASVDFQYVTSRTGTPVGYAIGGVPFISAPPAGELQQLFSDYVDIEIRGGFFYTITPALNVIDVTIGNSTGYICEMWDALNDTAVCTVYGPTPFPPLANVTFTRLVSNGFAVPLPNLTYAISAPLTPTARPRPRAPVVQLAPSTGAVERTIQPGEIAGIVVVAVLVLGLIGLAIFLFRRRMQKKKAAKGEDYEEEDEAELDNPENPVNEGADVEGADVEGDSD